MHGDIRKKVDHIPSISGIYEIKNILNDKVYIGSSKNIKTRVYNHLKDLISNKHPNKKLQNSWNKYGSNSFIFSFKEECLIENLIKIEQEYIDSTKPYFNINLKAYSCIGLKHSEENKKRWSIQMLGVKNVNAKLTEDLVREIRKELGTCKSLSFKYGISAPQIWKVKSYKSYKNVI